MEYAINRLSLIKPQYKNFFGFSQIDVFEKYLNTKKSREKTKKSEQFHGIYVHILECMHEANILSCEAFEKSANKCGTHENRLSTEHCRSKNLRSYTTATRLSSNVRRCSRFFGCFIFRYFNDATQNDLTLVICWKYNFPCTDLGNDSHSFWKWNSSTWDAT